MLNPSFNRVVWHMATTLNPQGWDTSSHAPDTLSRLRDTVQASGRMIVSRDHSDHTIFDDPSTNVAFRAWHDWCHLALNAEFDLSGEQAVCALQSAQLIASYGIHNSHLWRKILHAEIIGQAEHCATHGDFPPDQIAFDLAYMEGLK
jgi:hypothetical protein